MNRLFRSTPLLVLLFACSPATISSGDPDAEGDGEAMVNPDGGGQAINAVDDFVATDEGVVLTIDVLANDTAGGALTVTDAEPTTTFAGSTALGGNSVTYTPPASARGLPEGAQLTDTFSYGVVLGETTARAIVHVVVRGKNEGPETHGLAAGASENQTLTLDLSTAATDADAEDTVTLSVEALSAKGAAVHLEGNNLVWEPAMLFDAMNAGQTDTDTVTVTAKDSKDASATFTVTITITGENDGPQLSAASASTDDRTQTSIDLNLLATDPDGPAGQQTFTLGTIVLATGLLTVTDGTGEAFFFAAGNAAFPAAGVAGRVSLNAGVLTFEPNDAFDYLPLGSSLTITVPLGTDDGAGGTANAEATFIINGVDNDDLVEGTADNDVLEGGVGSDHLYGLEGADSLDGGTGADELFGGPGDDEYFVDDPSDAPTEVTGEGNDRVHASIDWALGADLERLVLEGAAQNGDGNTLDNVITGNALVNTLKGFGGNDTLDGGGGADSLQGGLGDDIYYVDDPADVCVEAAGEGTDRVYSPITYSLAASTNVERLTLGDGDINGTGNAAVNTIDGGAGNNVLDGGTGADVLSGGPGNDICVFDNAGDSCVELAGEGNDRIRASVTVNISGTPNIEEVELTGSGALNITGNSGANVLIGNGGANAINGGLGADSMSGGLGNDAYSVDDVGDVVNEAAGEGTDRVESTITYTLPGNVENLTLMGGTVIDGNGNTLDNTLIGNTAANVLDGKAGADILRGLGGNDTYIVDNAGDTVDETATGSAGTDLVRSTVTFTLPTGVENLTLEGTDPISGTGNTVANAIRGDLNTAANVLTGLGGNDTYTCDAGDTVVEALGGGTDLINAIASYTLPANVENLTLTGTGPDSGTGNSLTNTITGNGNANTLSGGDGDDTLVGGGGNDTLNGDDGADNFNGNAGNDIINGGAGDDIINYDVNDTVDGGTGKDKVSFVLAAASPVLNNVATLKFKNIEIFDLGDVSQNCALTLTADVVHAMTEADVLYVRGNNLDTVTLSGGSWTDLGEAPDGDGNWHNYSHLVATGTVTVKVQATIPVNLP